MKIKNLKNITIATVATLSFIGCSNAGVGVSLKSSAYNSSVTPRVSGQLTGAAATNTAGINSFQFCVTQIKLEGSGGGDVLEARLGLISPNSGTVALDWGSLDITEETTVSVLKVEVHADAQTCGVEHSVEMNGLTLKKDIEFTFNLASEITISEGSSINLHLSAIASAFKSAIDASAFTEQGITAYFEQMTSSAE